MLVVDEISVLIREFTFEAMESQRRQSKTLEMSQILPDGLLVVDSALLQSRKVVVKRRIVVHAE